MSEARTDVDVDVAVVVGVGPGLGGAAARRFAREGHATALMARSFDSMRDVHDQITQAGGRSIALPTDATDPTSISDAFAEVRERLGEPAVVVYNAGGFQQGNVVDVTPEQFEASWRASCFGAFLVAREAAPAMLKRGRGTLIFTGATASLRGSAGFSCFAVGKFGLRALAQSLARELGPAGVHVAHVIIDGQIDTPRLRKMSPHRPTHTMVDPDAIAKTYWDLHTQAPSAWTLELDLRPNVEKF